MDAAPATATTLRCQLVSNEGVAQQRSLRETDGGGATATEPRQRALCVTNERRKQKMQRPNIAKF